MRTFVRAVQRMAVHFWAAEKGLVIENDVDGHEAALEDNIFGIDDFDNADVELQDPYIDAFNDMLSATEPEADNRLRGDGLTDMNVTAGTGGLSKRDASTEGGSERQREASNMKTGSGEKMR